MGMIMQITIQRAMPEQHERLTHITFAAKKHWGYPERWMEIWKEALTITPQFIANNEVYAAMVESEVAGFYGLIVSEDKVQLEHMWVDPDYIGSGIGKRLFDHAIEVAESLNASSMEIESDPNAEGFYKRMGARRIGEFVSELEGQPRVLPLLVVDLPSRHA
jgi:GNAT superfamily N-acetyltransferase